MNLIIAAKLQNNITKARTNLKGNLELLKVDISIPAKDCPAFLTRVLLLLYSLVVPRDGFPLSSQAVEAESQAVNITANQ
jgi:hypothetical protein